MNDRNGKKIRLNDNVMTNDDHIGAVLQLDGTKVKVWLRHLQDSRMYYPEQLEVLTKH